MSFRPNFRNSFLVPKYQTNHFSKKIEKNLCGENACFLVIFYARTFDHNLSNSQPFKKRSVPNESLHSLLLFCSLKSFSNVL